jgi:methyl-accepting chemotaxis protein
MSPGNPGAVPGGTAIPVWLRLVWAISAMLLGTWSVMIYITYAQQRDESIAQSRNFAQSVHQMTVATITAMMITDTSKRRDVFLDQIRNSSDVTDIRVLRFGSVIDQYGAGELSERNHSPEEKAAMEKGQPFYQVSEDGAILQAVIPIRNSPNFLGKDCTKCHDGKAGEVLGAVSMKLRLEKAQAALRDFTWRLVLLALALSVPLLGSIYYFVRRLVNRPLGGEPAAAMAVVNRVAAGDLLVDIDVKDTSRLSLLLSLKEMVGSLTRIVGEVRSSARAFSGASEQLSAAAQSMNEAASEQAASVEETSAAVEQMTATITQNAQSARLASELAVSGSEVARKGGQVVGQVVATMESISDSSRRIADIIGVIDGIAFQTNILALNAAVEAARAGEQGRGFAVVAAEVRNLAQRSAAAAKEIKTLIGDSVDKVQAGTRLVDEAGQTMEEIVGSVKQVSDKIAEIAAASQEQSSGIGQINIAMTQLSQIAQQNAASSEELAATSEQMSGQAQGLHELIGFFQIEGDQSVPFPAPAAQEPGAPGGTSVRRIEARKSLTAAGSRQGGTPWPTR